MFQDERLIAIMQQLREKKRIGLEEICQLYGVSRDTARRDIVKLEEQGKIVRTRGGAILPTLSKEVSDYQQRLREEPSSKQAIGKLAATLIHDRDYLYMDASTTVLCAAEFMRTKKNVVVTNSIDIARVLTEKEEIVIHMLGGIIANEHRVIFGARAQEMLAEYQVDKMFIGACGITTEGLSTPHEVESYLIREAIRRADQVIVLADHTKFGKRLFHRFAGFEDVDLIVTDKEPGQEIKDQLQHFGVEIMVATEEDQA